MGYWFIANELGKDICDNGLQAWEEVQTLNGRVYEYESLLYEAGETGGAYVIFPYDVRKEFGRGRLMMS